MKLSTDKTKYTDKLLKVIKTLPELDNLFDFSDILAHPVLKFINGAINQINPNKVIEPRLTESIKKLHELNEPPLMYLYLKNIFETKPDLLVSNIKKFNLEPKIFSTLASFIKWYKVSHQNINVQGLNYSTNSTRLNKLIFKPPEARTDLHKLLYSSPFVSLDIQMHGETVDMTRYEYKTQEYNLIIYCPDGITYNINKIIHIIVSMRLLGTKDPNYPIPKIILFLSSQKKQIDSFIDSPLTPQNVNSGSSLSGEFIMIWRIEELYKVLIHELIHFYGLDFHCMDNKAKPIMDYINKTFNISGFDAANESYTETLALIIHSCFVYFYTQKPMEQILQNEIKFTLFQVAKICAYYSIGSVSELKTRQIKQTSSICSYYIVKSSLLINLFSFLNFLDMGFDINNRIQQFTDLVSNSLDSKKYLNLLDKYIKHVQIIDDTRWTHLTLRMVCSQI